MVKISFGMDDVVKVVLTEESAQILNARDSTKKGFAAGNTFEAEVWKLFQIFGPHCQSGESLLFTSIEIREG
jgi:hypothetical protein